MDPTSGKGAESRFCLWKRQKLTGYGQNHRIGSVYWRIAMKWVTRERPKIDRIACPCPIRRFIDREAEFL
jgi:hypothetical protein